MFKIGDKVVCIDNTYFDPYIIIGNTYTVSNIIDDSFITFHECQFIYYKDDYVSIARFRKEKLNKLSLK